MAIRPSQEISGPLGTATPPVALSERQSLIWLDSQLFPSSHSSNLVLLVEIRGRLDHERMRQAWHETVQDFDALHLRINAHEATQAWGTVNDSLPFLNLASEDDLHRWVRERVAEPLGPGSRLWESALLSAGADYHAFYMCQHHLIADGLSMVNLMARLSARYEGMSPPAPGLFADYLKSEAAYAKSEKAEKDRAYWTRYLKDPPPPIQLYGQERVDSSVGLARIWLDQTPAITQKLRAVSTLDSFSTLSPNLSRVVTLATAMIAFLSRSCGNSEVLLGIPYGNRTRPFNQTYGLLMEQTFLRAQVQEGDTYESLAARVKQGLVKGMQHGRACVSDHDLEYATLNMLPTPPSTFGALPAEVHIGPAPTRTGTLPERHADLRDTFGIHFFDFENESLRVGFDFHEATFSKALRERVCDHFQRILVAMAESPEELIDSVSLLDEGQRQQVLRAGQGHQEPEPAPDVVAQFRRQVALHADKTAIRAEDYNLTYAQLDMASSRLAQEWLGRGLGAGTRVALAMPRGARELAAMLAILKAGGVYIPIDARHPAERIQTILEDAKPSHLIAPSDSTLGAVLPADTQAVALDTLSLAERTDPLEIAMETPPQGALAYILFTSGSTGRPKGVSVPRSALANFLRSMAHTPGMTDDDHLLAVTTTTFDIAGLELWLPLWTGATVTIADHDTTADPRRLRAVLDTHDFSLMQATPATWRMLLDTGWVASGHLRILCGGEALSPDLARRLLRQTGELWNLYGPTETTIWSTAVQIEPDFDTITIGQPIDETQVLILDDGGNLVPPGVVGEIYIGGAGLAQGYCDRPELTEKSFRKGLLDDPEARLYRTGDLGRLREDGRFECLGRTDHQIKIRGFRIELGEIEAALQSHPGVQAVLATADQRVHDEPAISFYWTGSASLSELQALAQRKLPQYMTPSAYMNLESFPLNTSGKIDRHALPSAQRTSTGTRTENLPRNDREVQIASVWRSVLDLGEVTRDANFFDLGGTSILIISLRDQLERELGVEIPLRACFDHPTVGTLAQYMEEPRAASDSEPIVSWLREGSDTESSLFCLYGVHLYQDLARAISGSTRVLGMHIPITYDPETESCPSVADAAQRYVVQIRRHQARGPYRLAGLCFGGLVAYEAARQLEAAGEVVEVLALFDTRLPQARKVRRIARAFSLLRSGFIHPQDALDRLNRRWLARRTKRTPSPSRRQDGRIELPIRGEKVEEQARSYAVHASPIEARVLLFRATKEPDPEWLVYERDFGWKDLTTQLTIHDIPGSHLEIIQKPHSETVAAAIEQVAKKS